MKLVKTILIFALSGALLIFAGCQKTPEVPVEEPDAELITPVDTPAIEETPAPAPTPLPSDMPSQVIPTATPDDSDLDGIPDPSETPLPSGTLEDYKKKNKDVVGWIKVPNTKIDYPVVMGEDNDYYLRYNVLKKKSKYGAIFMDFRNKDKAQQRHLIIYGHRMRDKSMFYDLIKYKEKDFFDKNDKITLNFDGKDTTWQVFSAHNYDVKKANFTATEFGSGQNFADYMKGVKEASEFTNDVTIGKDDQVLTLLTCTYEFDNARYVVHFKKVKS